MKQSSVLNCIIAILAFVFFGNFKSTAQTLNPSSISTNGTVNVIVQDSTNIYIGGSFSAAGYKAGGIAKINSDAKTAPEFPSLSGQSYATVSDGAGGWYVGGSFSAQGLSNLVHILTDNTIDASFAPNPNSQVNSLYLDGTTLYVGGYFSIIASQTQSYIAKLDATTGTLQSWNPNSDGAILTITKDVNTIYVGGSFSNIGGKKVRNLAALDANTALSLPFISASSSVTSIEKDADNFYMTGSFSGASGFQTGANAVVTTTSDLPDFNFPKISGYIYKTIPDGNGGWYVGGQFNEQGVTNLAHILSNNTIDTSFAPNPNSIVQAMYLDGTTLYVGGSFDIIASQTQSFIAKLNATTGTLQSWNPNSDGAILTITKDVNTIYVGGSFSNIGGKKVRNLAALDANTALSLPFISASSSVTAIEKDADNFYITGNFSGASGFQTGGNAIVTTTSDLPDFNFPKISGQIYKSIPDGNGGWYVGGNFTEQGVSNLAHILSNNTIDTSFAPNPNSTVQALYLDGTTLYVGGSFNQIASQTQSYIAKLDATTGTLQSWNPNSDGAILTITKDVNTIYVGGSFSNIGGKKVRNLAALDANTALSLPFISASSSVTAIEKDADNFYITGNFSGASGFQTGGNAIVTTTSDLPDFNFPKISGQIYKSIPDGNGGWYVGGNFTEQGVSNLAHILSNNTIDTSFAPNPNSTVQALYLDGTTLYVGGSFSVIASQTQSYIAALNGTTGALQSWNPNSDSVILSITKESNTIYVGGSFSNIGGQNRNGIAALNSIDALATAWNPNVFGGNVSTMIIVGTDIIIGGTFIQIGAQSRNNLGAISLSTGNPTPWNPNPDSVIYAIEINGANAYISGNFSNIGGQPRNRIAEVSLSTGNATLWNPNPNGYVLTLKLIGTTIYAGGDFTTIGGQTRNYLAALNNTNGNATSWNPSPNSSVISLASNGTSISVSGNFDYIKSENRNYLMAVAKSNSLISSWNPSPDGPTEAIELNGTNAYIGGSFTNIGGQPRNRIAEVSLSTGSATSWNPNANYPVRALKLIGTTIYAGGDFTTIGGQNRNYLAALNNTNGNATSWNAAPNSSVFSIAVNGTSVLVSGYFDYIKSENRNYAMAIAKSNSLITSWNPNPDGPTEAIELNGTNAYIGGSFTNIGGQPRNRIAEVSLSTGSATSWNPNANYPVRALKLIGTTIYAGGDFTTIGGQNRNYLAALNNTNGNATSWNAAPNSSIFSIAVNGTSILVSGYFDYIKSENRNYAMAIAKSNSLITSWNPNPDGPTEAIELNGTNAYIGGSFTNIGGQPRNRIAEVSLSTGNATAWNPNANSSVRALKLVGTTIYAGGDFTTIGGQTRNYLAALDNTTGISTTWNPKADGSINKINQSSTDIIASGNFTFMNSEQRNNLMSVSKETGLINAWSPNPNSTVETIKLSGTNAYVGGSFNNIGGQPRNSIANVSLVTGNATVWNPNANANVKTIELFGNTIYAGGSFTNIGGQTRNNIAALNISNNNATTWNPDANGPITKLVVSDSLVYVAGEYSNIAGQVRNRLSSFKIEDTSITTWNPDVNGPIYDLQATGSNIYIGGSFNQVSGFERNNLASFSKNLGVLRNWNPTINGPVTAILPRDNFVYTGGFFTAIGGQTCSNFAIINANTAIPKLFFPTLSGQISTFSASDNLLYAGGSFTSINGTNYGGLASFSYPESTFTPSVDGITPDFGGIGGDIAISISGIGFDDGTTVTFKKSGETDIVLPSSSTFIFDGIRINAVLDLHLPIATGLWDVVINIPNQNEIILSNAFDVREGLPAETEATIVGFGVIRPDVWQSYSAVVQNLGNFDQRGVPLYIAVDNNVEIDFINNLVITDEQGNLVNSEVVPEFIQTDSNFNVIGTKKVYVLLIGNIPPLQSAVINLKLKVPSVGFTISAWTQPSIYGSPACPGLFACFDDVVSTAIGAFPGPGCVYGLFRAQIDPAIKAAIRNSNDGAAFLVDYVGGTLLALVGCLPLGGPAAQLAARNVIYRTILAQTSTENILDSCGTPDPDCGNKPPFKKVNPQQLPVTTINSFDPNDKAGPLGIGIENFIQPSKIVPYIIRCENFADATAAAQTIRIVDVIDQSVFDLSTFQLGFISIRDSIIPVPSGLKHYETDVDLRPANNIIARIVADLDMATGTATWTFKSIDPLTLLETENPFAGILPPNINSPEGEGAVMFTIKTLPSISNNTQIKNKAAIYFDTNDPIITNEWLNTSDIVKPVSQISIPPTNTDFTINLTWNGSDVGSGVRSYAIYYSKNGQPFEVLRSYVVGNTYSFDGELDQTYSFFTIATDNVGNVEDMKTAGDVQFTLGTPKNELLSGIAIYPNPNKGNFTLYLNSRNNEVIDVTITDIVGRNILSKQHNVDIGNNYIPLNINQNGIYFVSIDNKKSKVVKKVIVKN